MSSMVISEKNPYGYLIAKRHHASKAKNVSRAMNSVPPISPVSNLQALAEILLGKGLSRRDSNFLSSRKVSSARVKQRLDPLSLTGLGNLIIGYNEPPDDFDTEDREGSHNLVIGPRHRFSSWGGLVAGYDNTITGPYCTVSGGSSNRAAAEGASVSGGGENHASAYLSSVSGGSGRVASEFYSWAAGDLYQTQ
jgi:hypothetical protein